MTLDAAAEAATAALAAAVRRLANTQVLVIGDAMLDRYIYGAVDRISPEAPVPVLKVENELAVPGGAANVVRNLAALRVAVAFVSIIGDDEAGGDLTGLIGNQPGVEPWLLVQGRRITTLKTRFVAQGRAVQGHQIMRADREDSRPIHPKLADRLLKIARDAIGATSVVILSDYRKGVLAGDMPAQIIAAARQAGRRIVADVHAPDYHRYEGADVVMAAARDLAVATGMPTDGDASVAAAAAVLRARHGFGAVLVTRGEDGMTLVDAAGTEHFPAESAEVFDIAGTGDTALATLGAGLAAGLELRLATRLANIAASVVVGKIGTSVVRESDLIAAISPNAGALRKIVSREVAARLAERWRHSQWRVGYTDDAFDPLKPGHVHLIEQAHGACDRLIVGVQGDAAVRAAKGPNRPHQTEAVRAARLASLPAVDLVIVDTSDSADEMIRMLRPHVVVKTSTEARDAAAAVMQEWNGSVMLAEMLPEIATD
jgi:D-beta-D-heptose 7-phosphate kinase/D-beta-D-heptose 1-phosphate adenosyltransferase